MATLPEPEFDKRLFVPVPQNDPIAVSNARILLEKNGLPSLPEWWSYTWVVERDPVHELTGTFPKRLKKWLYIEHQIKVSDKVAADIGERMRTYLPPPATYEIDFVRSFNWTPGTFGESNTSCWWNANNDARAALENAGGFAIRSYSPLKGRAWVMPRPEAYFVFNGYGLGHHAFSKIMAHYLGLSAKHDVSLLNLRRPGGLVYINSGIGSAVGQATDLEPLPVRGRGHYDLQIDVSEWAFMCNYCGRDMYGLNISPDSHGHVMCTDCRAANAVQTLPLFSDAIQALDAAV